MERNPRGIEHLLWVWTGYAAMDLDAFRGGEGEGEGEGGGEVEDRNAWLKLSPNLSHFQLKNVSRVIWTIHLLCRFGQGRCLV
jgi:hypothetical protein